MRSGLFSFLCIAHIGLSIGPTAFAGELYDAVLAGKPDAVQASIAAGADLNEQGDLGTPLHVAAGAGDLAIIRVLLDSGADIEATRLSSGGRPLHEAVAYDHPEAVLLLLEKGAEVDPLDALQRTPLGLAARSGNLALARILLTRGADVNLPGYRRNTHLHWAAMNDKTELLQLFLDHHANLNARSSSGETPLHLAAAMGRRSNKDSRIPRCAAERQGWRWCDAADRRLEQRLP